MAHYLVRARPQRMAELKERLDSGEIGTMRPFGGELQSCLQQARIDAAGWVVWEENCFCAPPLKQERVAVLDTYFDDLSTEPVPQGAGWAQIQELPFLWDARDSGEVS
ncbi:MAG: hypothetical protein MI924_19825 [Chloroflexales bacterium]|nr:hypothetical protein [Chloroflexales bacterium]